MGSVAVIYVPSFIKIGSGVRKLIGGGGCTHTHGQQCGKVQILGNDSNNKITLI
jgi:hypothetical protein